MIIFGSKTSNIGNFVIPNSKCEYCEKEGTQRITVFGNYVHIFWVPFFPIGRDVFAECTHCKRTLEQKEFSPKLNQQYLDNKINFKRPFWHWFGLGLVGFFIAFVFLIGLTT